MDDIDADDTISEVDVYLAYGLHGQAEELLSKAVSDNPGNADYAAKLLQTYHAQGNAEAFNSGAADFRQQFGESNEHWPEIVSQGIELEPGNTLFSGGAEELQRMGTGDLSAPKLESHDFVTSEDSAVGSINRDFSSNDDADSSDETDLMDQSLDPGFAFDESDLEATGDFSEAAAEIASDSGTIEFPDFDKTDAPTISDDSLDGALTLDELDIGDVTAANSLDDANSVADDLTLDLDKLSGDLDLDSTSLLDGGDGDSLEIPDLTSDNDLLSGTDSADEMDTMMDLAKAYIDMGDKDSASSALGEIVKSGNPAQVSEAETLLRKIS
jgi:pilus assembly protein FimV